MQCIHELRDFSLQSRAIRQNLKVIHAVFHNVKEEQNVSRLLQHQEQGLLLLVVHPYPVSPVQAGIHGNAAAAEKNLGIAFRRKLQYFF